MRLPIQKKHLPIFIKIVLMFMAAVIPVYICGLWNNMSSQADIQKEIFKSAKPKIDYYVGTLENEFRDIIKMRLNFYTDKDLQSLSVEANSYPYYDKCIIMQHMQKKLVSFKDAGKYITAVSVYIPLVGKTISNSTISEMSDTQFKELEQTIESGQNPFVEKDGRIFMYFMPFNSDIPIHGKATPPYIISLELSKDIIAGTLKQFTGTESGSAFLKGYDNGLNITGNAEPQTAEKIAAYLDANSSPDGETHVTRLGAEGHSYILIHKKSETLKTYFVMYVPEDKLLLPLLRYRVWIWIASLITAVLVLLFSVWIYRMVVQPLNTLMNAVTKMEKGDFNISLGRRKEDEFGFLYQRINMLCGRMSVLIDQVYELRVMPRNSETKQTQLNTPLILGMMDSIQSACRQIYGIWASSATSGKEADWNRLNAKFEELEEMMSHASALDDEAMPAGEYADGGITPETEKRREEDKLIRNLLKKTQLMEILLESGQQEEFLEIYTAYFAGLKGCSCASTNMKQEAYYTMAMIFLSCINKIGLSERVGKKITLGALMKMEAHPSWDEADIYFKKLAHIIFEQINAEKINYGNRIISFVQSYIEQNIGSDLSLTKLSETLHFNPSYFSRMFKSISGKGLVEYIAEIKLSKAKTMLAGDTMLINEIAESLGFEAASSFARFFRKYTNQSPQEYKDSLMSRPIQAVATADHRPKSDAFL